MLAVPENEPLDPVALSVQAPGAAVPPLSFTTLLTSVRSGWRLFVYVHTALPRNPSVMLAVALEVWALVPVPLVVQERLSSDHAAGRPLSVTEYEPAWSFSNFFSPPPLSWNAERPEPLVVYENGPPPLGTVTFLTVIEPHVSMLPVEKSLRSAFSACETRVFVRNVEKQGTPCGNRPVRSRPPSKKYGAVRLPAQLVEMEPSFTMAQASSVPSLPPAHSPTFCVTSTMPPDCHL